MPASEVMLGVIEGFYGRAWSHAMRLRMLEWLPSVGIDAYLYAPKSDAYLRKQWRDVWPAAEQRRITALVQKGQGAGIGVYVGLSPFAVYVDYDAAAEQALRRRVFELCAAGIHGLGLLFDDMPGNHTALAARQGEIAQQVKEWCGEVPLLVCPTYYSADPVLDRVFGERPPAYLEQLSSALPQDTAIFWTGPQVCSREIAAPPLQAMRDHLGTPLALWDNYPVNDSRERSEHLYVQDLSGRDPVLRDVLHSHWCNAMNQPALSLPALASLGSLYGRPMPDLGRVYAEAGLSDALLAAVDALAIRGRGELTAEQESALCAVAELPGPAAAELRDWLAGRYEFDPACLTD